MSTIAENSIESSLLNSLLEVEETTRMFLLLHNEKNCFSTLPKLMEECGELAQAVISVSRQPNASESGAGKSASDVQEECVDALIILLDIFFMSGGTIEQFISLVHRKTQKWANKAPKPHAEES